MTNRHNVLSPVASQQRRNSRESPRRAAAAAPLH